MTNVSIDDVRRLAETELSQHLVLCDKTGRVLGHYLPTPRYNRLVCQSESARVSTEGVAAAPGRASRKSLAEIWDRLEKS
jgi:hypothetical protein